MAPKKKAAAKDAVEPTPKKAGRPKKEEEPPAKRGRPKAEESAATAAATNGKAAEGEEEAKKAKSPVAPKRDKDTPLKRSLTPRELAPGARVLKVLSLNVAGLRSVLASEKRAQRLHALLEREKPHIMCFSETKLKEEDVPDAEAQLKELLPKEYATFHWSCSTAKKGYSGVAMLLRHALQGEAAPIADPAAATVTCGMGDIGKDDPIIGQEGRVLTLELPELFVVTTYVPNSGQDLARLPYRVDRQAKSCWDRDLGEYVRGLRAAKSKPVVVIGDLNCCHRVQDIWNMHDRPDFPDGLAEKPFADQYTGLTALKKQAGLTPEERSSFSQLLEDADLVDTFRKLHPDACGVFTYFSQRLVQNRPMNKGLRLDYVLASSSMCKGLKPKAVGEAGNGAQQDSPAELPCISDSFILDGDELIADHTPVGCDILLPPT